MKIYQDSRNLSACRSCGCNCHSGFIFDLEHECPDEEMVPHAFKSRTPYEPGDDRDIWCKDCEYHRDHQVHARRA
jgi:hypothetical protein